MSKFFYNIADKNASFLINCKIFVTRDTEKQTLLVTNTPQSSSLKENSFFKTEKENLQKFCLFIRQRSMETKQNQRQKSLKVHLKVKYSHVRQKLLEYGLDSLKRCLCFARRNPENLSFKRRRLSSFFIFIFQQWLVITASREDLAAVVFVCNKFMSSYGIICLVIARVLFLLQSDCSAITKVRNFSLLSLLYN